MLAHFGGVMLNSFSMKLDINGLLEKLRRYFNDTSPALIDITVDVGLICITNTVTRKTVEWTLDSNLSVYDNIAFIIAMCEDSLYPRIIKEVKDTLSLSVQNVCKLATQGVSLENMSHRVKKAHKTFVIIRLNFFDNSLIYRDTVSRKRYKALMKYPLALLKDRLYGIKSIKEQMSMYDFIINNSTVKEL